MTVSRKRLQVQGVVQPLLSDFEQTLTTHPPPLAHIGQIQVVAVPVCNDAGFAIVESCADAASRTLISPDLAICEDCLRELFDPSDRRIPRCTICFLPKHCYLSGS